MKNYDMVKIGTIEIEGERDRYDICWNGLTLCDSRGEEIMDGKAETLSKAQELAAHLWEAPYWDYQEE